MTPEEFRRHGHALIDRIADYRADIANRPAMSRAAPGAIRAALPKSAPATPEPFAAIFREYASNVYESRLNEYHGESLRVTGSVARTPTDVIVQSQVFGGKLEQPVTVLWRVLAEGGGWKVVDVQVQGVWLAITEQQDFVSTIDNSGGNIQVLIDQLKRQVAKEAATG